MIDRSMIDPKRLLDIIMDDCAGNINKWWNQVEFVKNYMPPYPGPDTRPAGCVVKCGDSMLRDLGHGVFIWDVGYNSEEYSFLCPEQALLALMRAPVPPFLLKPVVWGRENDDAVKLQLMAQRTDETLSKLEEVVRNAVEHVGREDEALRQVNLAFEAARRNYTPGIKFNP